MKKVISLVLLGTILLAGPVVQKEGNYTTVSTNELAVKCLDKDYCLVWNFDKELYEVQDFKNFSPELQKILKASF